MQKLLQVKDLRVSYHTYAGEVQSVRGISFDVEQGEVLAIVGESGCGKSVTSRSLMGLIKGPVGEIKKGSQILYKGKNIIDFTDKEWYEYRGGECSIVFQDALTALNPTMTVGNQICEKIIIHQKLSKEDAMKEAVNMLKTVGIPNPEIRIKQYPHEFSGGMRQRVMIAIAFACNPNLIIADEPTTALDVTIQAQILDVIKDLQHHNNTSVVIITHDLGVVANVAKKIVVMYSGKIVEKGTCEDVFYSPKHPYTWALLNALPRLDLKNKQDLISIEGTPPDLIAPPIGCAFSTRCDYCMQICREETPDYTHFKGGHQAACWLHHEHAPKIKMPHQKGDE